MTHFESHILLGIAKMTKRQKIWYPKTDLPRHILILGMTGKGKTNFIYWIVTQLISSTAVWFFDRKEDFRHLLRLFPEILIFNLARDFKCNPLAPPPNVHPKDWLELFTDLFCRSNSLLDGSSGLLLKTLDGLYERYGVYDNSVTYPSLIDLLHTLKNLKIAGYSRSAGFRESLVNRLEAYITTNKNLFDCSRGFDIEKLLEMSVVFEMTGLLEVQANFWINFLLYWAFKYRIAKKERGNILRNVVVFDEAKSVFSPYENPALGFPPMTYMVSMLREFGVGIIAADQTAQLNNSIFANSQLKILFPLGSGDDLIKAQKSFGLRNEQIQYIHQLGVGEAIARHPKIVEPFVLKTPKHPLA